MRRRLARPATPSKVRIRAVALLAASVTAGSLLAGWTARPAAADGIFEPLPTEFTWNVVADANNLHFVLIPNRKSNIILAYGGIGAGDALRFSAALTAAKPVDEVQLYSPGGDLEEGIKIGLLIRSRGLATRVPDGARCVSACNFVFMGGVVRNVDPTATFEVHMFSGGGTRLARDAKDPPKTIADYNKRHAPSQALDPDAVDRYVSKKKQKDPSYTLEKLLIDQGLDEDVKDIQQDAAQTAAEIAHFLIGMRLSLDFLTAFAGIPNDTPRPLSRQELKDYNIVNN